MSEHGHQTMTAEAILSPLAERIGQFRDEWAGKTLADVYREMPVVPERIDVDAEHSVELVALEPAGGGRDDKSVVLGLPYLNGWTPHHYIRARALQQLVFPDSRVIVLPAEPDSVTLTAKDRAALAEGDGSVIAEQQMKALETLDLGATALTGYSWGATTAVNLSNVGSDRLEVVGINLDELPSEGERDAKALKKDFMKSGGFFNLRASVKGSEIPALSEAMSLTRLSLDIVRFGIRSLREDSKLLAEAMTGTAGGRIEQAVRQVGVEDSKIGYVEGSRIFHPMSAWITQAHQDARIVRYGGQGFHGHASADNVILHAAMVHDGIGDMTAKNS